ncbi:MAG: TRAP transporter substrate-binding protein, partial [Xanthobacteraceae bacterium]
NWAPNTDRYRRLAHFVEVFFAKINDFQKPPFHPKWKEVSLAASLRGWTRFKPAQDWLAQHANAAATPDVRSDFAKFLAAQGDRGDLSAEDRDALFQQFLEWQKRQGH